MGTFPEETNQVRIYCLVTHKQGHHLVGLDTRCEDPQNETISSNRKEKFYLIGKPLANHPVYYQTFFLGGGGGE